ncbi:hypothetical protein FRUB_03613 [Fimbriiglobus ruber]|uniref:Teneurin-like YD-shell domain-containing protein n=2 Tax=Fimbriiglobus ruber TaxID=1908690 RepID=A0A225DWQ2_9BACT|nr:hypothetical protein FRUB_03613 [Fimbriiglobus ruber]
MMPGGNLVSTSAYDEDGNVTLATDPKGDVTATTYDADGRVLTQAITDAVTGQVASTTNVYDADGRVTQFTDADGNVTLTGYDADGDVTSVAVGDQTTATAYDMDQRATKVTDGDGDVTLSTYDAAGNVLTAVTKSAAGAIVAAVTNAFDAAGRLTGMTDGVGNTTTYGYDAEGNQTAVDEPAILGEPAADTTSAYDGDGRVTSLTDGDGNVTSTTYDAAGNVLTTTVYGGTAVVSFTANAYDLAGHLTATTDGLGKTIDYAYDAAGRQTLVADLRDGTAVDTVMAYDAAGNATTTTDPLGTVTAVTYDDAGRPLTSTISFGGTLLSATTSAYDPDGRLNESIDPDHTVSRSGYDAAGNQTLAVDGDLTTTTEFDPAGRATQVTDPAGIVTSTTYDAAGNVTTAVTEVGGTVAAATTSGYDRDGRLTQSIDPDGHVAQYGYDADGNQTLIVAGDLTSTTEFDGDHRATRATDPAGNVTLTTFDADGNVLTSTTESAAGAVAASVTSSYDADGRLTQTVDGAGHTTTTQYDGRGNATATVDGTGATAGVTVSEYDADNRVTAVVDANGNTTLTAYDGEGRATAVTAGAGTAAAAVTRYTYDADGRTLSETDPDNNTTTYSYDEDGRLTLQVDAVGDSTVTDYDGDGRPTAQTDPDGRTTQSAYDAEGHATSVTWEDASGAVTDTRSYVYDPDGNLLSAINSAGTVTMEYDTDGRMTSRTDPSGVTLTFHYDGDGRATLVTDSLGATEATGYDAAGSLVAASLSTPSGSLSASLSYDGAGNQIGETRDGGTGGTATLARDDRRRVTSITQTDGAGAVVEADVYGYDAGSRMTTSVVHATGTSAGFGTAYGYDATNQMTTAGPATYTYDANGNRTGPGVVIDAGNRIHSDGTWVFTYDAAGNTIAKSSASLMTEWDYTYDDANQMTSATETVDGSTVITDVFAYDAVGDRVSQVQTVGTTILSTWYVTTGSAAWADATAGVGTTWYLNGNGPDARLGRVDSAMGGATFWDLTDPLGSVLVVAYADGSVADQITYDAFGSVTGQTADGFSGRMLYDGYEYDPATGLYHDNDRYYAPSSGRFMTQDPTGLGPDSNPYRYVGNGPMNGTDPTGRWIVTKAGLASALTAELDKAGIRWATSNLSRSTSHWFTYHLRTLVIVDPADRDKFIAWAKSMYPSDGGKSIIAAAFNGDLGTKNVEWQPGSISWTDGKGEFKELDSVEVEGSRRAYKDYTKMLAKEAPELRMPVQPSMQSPDYRPTLAEQQAQQQKEVDWVLEQRGKTRVQQGLPPLTETEVQQARQDLPSRLTAADEVDYQKRLDAHNRELAWQKFQENMEWLQFANDLIAVVGVAAPHSAGAGVPRPSRGPQIVPTAPGGAYKPDPVTFREAPSPGRISPASDNSKSTQVDTFRKSNDATAKRPGEYNSSSRQPTATEQELLTLTRMADAMRIPREKMQDYILAFYKENTESYRQNVIKDYKAFLTAEEKANRLCFIAGTPLLTPYGSKNIELFDIGDEVLSRSSDDLCAPVTIRRVDKVFVRSFVVLELFVAGKIIGTTGEHPFYERSKGWCAANELCPGDQLATHQGEWVDVEGVRETNEIATVYNICVVEDHTYFVGCAEWGFSVWAHNAGMFGCGLTYTEAMAAGPAAVAEYNRRQDHVGTKKFVEKLTKMGFSSPINVLRAALNGRAAFEEAVYPIILPSQYKEINELFFEARRIIEDRETYATGSQRHHAIPWKNQKYNHQASELVKLSGIDLFTYEPNIKPVVGHRGSHWADYHQDIQDRLTLAYKNLPEKTREAAIAALNKVIEQIWTDIDSGKLRPYEPPHDVSILKIP